MNTKRTIAHHRIWGRGILLVAGMILALLPHSEASVAERAALDPYNVVWTTQSVNSSESMPCGGGDIGLNVWVEDGDLLFYAQRSGSFDENNEYLKLGRLRVRLTPNPFAGDAPFRQELKLHEGYVAISNPGGAVATSIRVWVEVHRPVVHIDIESAEPVSVEAAYEGWRNEDVALANDGKHSRFGCFSWDQYPGEVIRYHDEVRHDGDTVLFYHRNRDDRLLFDYMVEQQGLAPVKEDLVNTQQGRTFGGILSGAGFRAAGTAEGKYIVTPYKAWKLRSDQPAQQHSLTLHTHVAQTKTLEAWMDALHALMNEVSLNAEAETRSWWDAFWQRSWIVIDPDRPDPSAKPWQIGRNYQLFRYQLGCNAYGDYPTKFNGSNFTYDPKLVVDGRAFTPDWRAWGGGSFTAQNQRLVYWPMLKTGDFDMMPSQFEFYRRALPNATARVKTYWGHKGCLFTEQMENFGMPLACAWGWEEEGAKSRQRPKNFERGVQVNGACIYHYESQLEFSYMILEHHRFTGGDLTPYLPFITRSVRFFDEHYQMREKERSGKPLDENGKLVIYPSTSCESYKGAKNPSDLISGLRACLVSLLELDDALILPSEKDYYRAFLGRVPDYGYDEVDGDRVVKPAWSWEKYQNCECPQFYPLFPFDQFHLLEDDMTLFKNTWKHGTFPKDLVKSWHQDGIFFARMGMTDEAVDYNTKKMQDSGRRFPTFWGPGHDWVPDHNWGGSGMIGIQEMLMQTLGDSIHLLPAWPKAWDVDFKLHAPQQTIVVGRVRNGEIVFLEVTPEERRRDVFVGSPLIRHTVIETATADVPRSDTASVAELLEGRLMVVYHKYEGGKHAGHDEGICRIWSKFSHDGGVSWQDPRMLVDVAEGDMNVQAPTLLRLKSGRLMLACLRAHKSGASSTMGLFASSDEGESFTPMSPVWERSEGQLLQGGASSLVQLASGRLILPFHGGSGNQWKQRNSAWCFFSDDEGKTWQRSTRIDLPKRGAMEGSVAELADGTLLMSLRTQLGGPYLARSTDGGCTWSEATFSNLEGGESCTCLRRIPGTEKVVLFWNNSEYHEKHHHYGERTPLTAAISKDNGKTWQTIGNVADDPESEYTNLDCLFTSKGNAILTYMHAKPAWNRKEIHLKAALIDKEWFKS